MVEKGKTNYRVGMATSVVLIIIAGIFDGIGLIPLVGTFAAPIFWTIAGAYFWTKGMGILNGRKLAVTAISFVAELIPVVQELPMLVAGIIGLLLVMRIEDKTGMSVVKPMQKGIKPPRFKRIPLNSDGVRHPNNTIKFPENNDSVDMEQAA